MSGGSWGFFIWPPIARILINKYTWRGSYIVQAGIVLNCLVCGFLLHSPPRNKKSDKTKTDLSKKKRFKCELKYLNWLLFMMSTSLLSFGQYAGAVYLPVKGHLDGISATKIPFLASAVGITGIIMRPFSGFLGDLKCTNRQFLSASMMALSGLTFICISFVSGFGPLMAMAVVSGTVQGE